jgi:hypothetical protein
MHSDEFIKSIRRYEKKIRQPRSIFDVIDSFRFFAKTHQCITKAQRSAFEIALSKALDYASLYNLDLRTKFPADARGKNKIWREDIFPMLERAQQMSREENNTSKRKPDTLTSITSRETCSGERLKPKAKPEHSSTLETDLNHSHIIGFDRQAESTIECEADKTIEMNKRRKQCAPKYFTLLPDWLITSISRKEAFELIPKSARDFAIDHRDLFGKWLRIPSKHELIEQKNIRQYLYLVICELNNHTFYKVGLTKHMNPLKRDPNVYKRVISCHEVDYGWATLYEMYCLWRCKQVRGKQPWDPVEFGWWPGKSEMIRSLESKVEDLFSEAYNELQTATKSLNSKQVLFEWYLLDSLVKAIYDERYTSSALAVYSIIDKIACHYGERIGDPDDYENVELHPAARQYLTKRLVNQLAPIIDQKWDELNIRCPVSRYHMGKRLYEDWCYETWGETCWSNAQPYRNMITFNSLQDLLKEKLNSEYKVSINKVFAKQVPAQQPPIQLTALSGPCLPTSQKKRLPSRSIAYPNKLKITYQDLYGDITVREISILDETLHSIDAFCHLRQDKRTFNIWRIVSVQQEDGAECWGPKYFYTLRLGSSLDLKNSLRFSIGLHHEAYKIATRVTTRMQLAALGKKVYRAEIKMLEAKTDRAHDIAYDKSALLQEAYSLALEHYYEAQYRPGLTSPDSLFLTLFQLSYSYKTVPINVFRELRRAYSQLGNKDDWLTFSGDDIPDVYSIPVEVLKQLTKFRKIIEGSQSLEEQLKAIDLLAYSDSKIFNNYFNLRGSKRPSEQWLIMLAEKSQYSGE